MTSTKSITDHVFQPRANDPMVCTCGEHSTLHGTMLHLPPPDGDVRDLGNRATRLAAEVTDMAMEAIRVRDQHREQIAAMGRLTAKRDDLLKRALGWVYWAQGSVDPKGPNAENVNKLVAEMEEAVGRQGDVPRREGVVRDDKAFVKYITGLETDHARLCVEHETLRKLLADTAEFAESGRVLVAAFRQKFRGQMDLMELAVVDEYLKETS